MDRYSDEVVKAYVNGDDMPDYDIEALEDDVGFMIRVIEYTNDKEMCNMCSDKVKSTYEFVRFLIGKFGDDLNFIRVVVDNYLENVTNEIEMFELLIIMSNLVRRTGNDDSTYNISLGVNYLAEKNSIYIMSMRPELKKLSNMIQAGFIIIYDKYNSSDVTMGYFTKRFIADIIADCGIDLESRMHADFESLQELEDFGIASYLLNLLSSYDSFLSKYLAGHLELLADMMKDVNRFKGRWNSYYDLKEIEKYKRVFDAVSEYIDTNNLEADFPETSILYYIGMELGVADVMVQYDNSVDDERYNFIKNSLIPSYCSSVNERIGDPELLKHYQKIGAMMEEILFPEKAKLHFCETKDSISPQKRSCVLALKPLWGGK